MKKASPFELFILVVAVVLVSGLSQWWAGREDRALGPVVAALAKPGDIRMLSSETCSICAAARSWFKEHHIAYSECTIERDRDCRAAYEASASPGTPVLMVRGHVEVGFNPERLQRLLANPA